MKRDNVQVLFAIAIAAMLGIILAASTGCQTTNNEQNCQAATAAYAVYLAIINADGEPSEDQLVAARAAAAYLAAYCGWQGPSKQLMQFDGRGVPKITAPK